MLKYNVMKKNKESVFEKIKKKHPIIGEIVEWIIILICAFAIALFINNFIITNSYIPTPSMESNLPVGSRLFGFRLYYKFEKPKRGDVVIFDYGFSCRNCNTMYQKNDEKKCSVCGTPDSKNKRVHYIKRVIGLPGDHIEIKQDYVAKTNEFKEVRFKNLDASVTCGHVYVNGKKLEENYLNEPMIVNDFFKEIDVVVPNDSYFLLGDNRNNSEDARFWPNTFVNLKDIEAKALFIYWPLNKIGVIK